MNIESFIQKEAPNDDVHDKAYARCLREAYGLYKGLELETLKEYQKTARARHDSSHRSTAMCMMLYKLIEEKERETNTMTLSNPTKSKLGNLYSPIYSPINLDHDAFNRDIKLVRDTKQYADYRKLEGVLSSATEYVIAKMLIDFDALMGGEGCQTQQTL